MNPPSSPVGTPPRRERELVPCPECDNGQVLATFIYANGDSTDVPAECPYCGGAGSVLASAVPRV